MNPSTTPSQNPPNTTVGNFSDRAAARADDAIESTRRVVGGVLDSLHDGVARAHDQVPNRLSRIAAQVANLTRRGIERTRVVSEGARDRVTHAGDSTVAYVKDKPVKSILYAAAAGAAAALLLRALATRHSD